MGAFRIDREHSFRLIGLVFLVPQVAALLVISILGRTRPYVVNVDFAVPVAVMAFAALLPAGFGKLVQTTVGGLALAAVAAIEMWALVGGVYMADPSMVLTMIDYAKFWPWRLLAPLGAMLLAAATGLAFLGAVSRRFAAGALGGVSLVVAVLALSDVGARMLGGPNILSSGAATLLRPYVNQLLTHAAPSDASIALVRSSGVLAQSVSVSGTPSASILSVAVESWGLPSDPKRQSDILSAWTQRFRANGARVSLSARDFHGSTVEGEIRELCALRVARPPQSPGEFSRLVSCVPHALLKLGYETKAWHGNSIYFYRRHLTYKAMGFQEMESFETMAPRGAAVCKRLFTGICDRTVLEEAVAWLNGGQRRFAHVMTLETHLPLPESIRWDCRGKNREICAYEDAMGRAMNDIEAAIAQIRVRPLRVFVYGDHAPPFLSREARAAYSRSQVPALTLELDEAPAASSTQFRRN